MSTTNGNDAAAALFLEPAVNIRDAAVRGGRYEARLGLRELPELASVIEASRKDASGGVEEDVWFDAHIGFDWQDDRRCAVLDVAISGQCSLLCQRCLEWVAVATEVRSRLAIGRSLDEDALVALGVEVWDHDDENIVLATLVDELILLELPMVVTHEHLADCGPLAHRQGGVAPAEDRQQPFADLREMLSRQDN